MKKSLSTILLIIAISINIFAINAPVHLSPSNTATDRDLLISLDWSGVTGNEAYRYQIDITPSFNSTSLVDDTTSVNSSIATASNLLFGTTYYWRVMTLSSSGNSVWTTAWSFTTKSTVICVSPTNGIIDRDLVMNLDWSSVLGNNGYMYEIDTTPNFNSPLFLQENTAISSSQASVSDLFFGTTYYWRACAKSVNDTSDWSTTHSFTTKSTVINVSPNNGAIDRDIFINVDWSGVLGNNGYMYQIDTTPNFNSPLFLQENTAVSSSNADVSELRFGTTYYWRACAKSVNDTSEWSTAFSFTTKNTVTNVSPSNGSTNQHLLINIDWSGIFGNNGYMYQLDTTPNFNSAIFVQENTPMDNSNSDINIYYFGTTYYWRVCAKSVNDTSEWSTTFNFTTKNTITNTSPSNNSVNIPIDVNLDWSFIINNDGYLCQIDTSPNFNSTAFQQLTSSVSSSEIDVNGLLYGTKYYWRAACKSTMDTSEFSTTWNFRTVYELTEIPNLVSPADLSTDISYTSVGIEWTSITGATTYQYEYSTDNTFATGVNSATTSLITGTISGLYPNIIYFWRVRGGNGAGFSPWSDIWQFTTESIVFPDPTLISPLNNSIGIDFNSVNLEWNSLWGATEYIYEISNDNTFVSGVTSETITATNKTLIGLAEDTQYFWRVKASDGATESNWSVVWDFTTDNSIGVSNINTEKLVSIYPNPTTGVFTVEGQGINKVEVIDITGKQVYLEADFNNNPLIIDLDTQTKGLYFVKIYTNNIIEVRKIVIN